jgi:hypothetical protein
MLTMGCSGMEAQIFYNTQWPALAKFLEVVFSPEKQAVTPLNCFSHEELYRLTI